MSTTVQKGSIWKHHKSGNIYTVDRVATYTETGEWLVIYTGGDGQAWARPESQFMDGRFTELERVAPVCEAMPTEEFLRQVVFR